MNRRPGNAHAPRDLPIRHAGRLRLDTLEGPGLRFSGDVDGLAVQLDGMRGATIASPMQWLIAALAACGAMDVISILRKKRQRVTAYEVTFRGERSTEHPKRFTEIEVVHIITGHDVRPADVAEAMRLSDEKYCSVHASLHPDIVLRGRFEVRPA